MRVNKNKKEQRFLMDEDRTCATCIYMDERMDPAFSEYAGLCRSNPPHVNEAGIAIWPLGARVRLVRRLGRRRRRR